MDVKKLMKGSSLTFRAQEGAAIYADLESSIVSVKAITAGIVQLRGKTDDLDVEVNTGGKFFGKQLKAGEAEASAGTGGQADVKVNGYLKATAKLGGVINVFGNPEEIDRKTTLGGKISEEN